MIQSHQQICTTLRRLGLPSVAIALLFGCTEKPPTSLEGIPTDGPYSATVQRIFNQSCNESGCHGTVNPGSGLELVSWERLIAGDRFGEVIIAYRPEDSHMLDHLTGVASPLMPLSRDPLPAVQIDTIRRWIAAGARNDDGEVPYANSRRKIYVCDQQSDKISVIDVEANVVARIIDVGVSNEFLEFPHNILVDPQGRYYYVTLIGTAKLLQFDALTDSLLRTTTVGQSPANPVTSPDGSTIYVTNWTGDAYGGQPSLYVLDTATLSERYSLRFPEPLGTQPHGLCVTRDGRTLFLTHQGGSSISKIQLGQSAEDAVVTIVPLGAPGLQPLQIVLDAQERFAYVTCYGTGEIYVVDTQPDPPEVVKVISGGAGGRYWLEALTPDGRYLYACNWGKDKVDVIDTQTQTLLTSISNAGRPDVVFARPHGVAITPDGRYAYISSENTFGTLPPHHGGAGGNGRITVIDVATNTVVKSLEIEKGPTGVAFISH